MDAMSGQDALLRKLRSVVPHRVRVYDSSDEHRDVAVPHGRKRWSHVVETVEARPWVRAELLDKAGAALAYVINPATEAEAGDLEDIGSKVSSASAQSRWMLELMLKAQRTALEFRDKEHAALLDSIRDMMGVQTTAMKELVSLYQVQRDVAADVATMKAAAESGGSIEQIVKLIEASPALLQVLGPVVQLLRPRIAAKVTEVKSTEPPAAAAPAKGKKP